MKDHVSARIRHPGDLKKIIIFFVIAFLFSWLCWLPPFINARTTDFFEPLLLFGMFATLGPLVSALILLGVYEGKKGVKQLLKSAWQWKFKKTWLLAIVILPIALTGLSLYAKILFEDAPFVWGSLPSTWLMLIVAIFFTGGALEEFGWRGYALPRMLKIINPLPASIIIGTLHALWHLPLRYIPGTVQSSMPFWQFSLATLVGAVIYTWIFLGTNGSLTAMILFHWIGNFTSAIFVYWDTNLGRWIFFILQLLAVVIIVITNRRIFLHTIKKQA